MVIGFFKSPQPAALFILPVITAAICGATYFANKSFAPYSAYEMPLFNLITQIPGTANHLLIIIVAWLLITSQALHFNKIMIEHEVLYKPSNLPSLIYVVVASMVPVFIGFHPVIFVNSILLFTVDKIFKLYKNPAPLAIDFDISFLIALASLFYLPCILLTFFFFISLIIVRPFSWRDWLVSLMGLLTPWFLLFTIFYLGDRTSILAESFSIVKLKTVISVYAGTARPVLFTLIAVALLLLLSLLKLRGNYYKNVIRTRNYQLVVFFMLMFTILITVIPYEKALFRFALVAIPASVFISYYFLAAKRAWYYESLFVLLVVIWGYNYIMQLS
jgi:Family of unknown function (DUF6427)